MAQFTRTAKGTATDKTGALTLTIAGMTLAGDGSLLVVGLAYDPGAGPPQIDWGPQRVDPVVTQAGGGIVCRVASYVRQGPSKTHDLVATWTTAAPTAKAMFATEVTGMGAHDIATSQSQAATTAPSSGAPVPQLLWDEFLVGVFASEGPSSDDAGTPDDGFTSGQRAGTAGPPPVSNVTIHETWKLVESDPQNWPPWAHPPPPAASASKTGATERDHSSLLVSFRPSVFKKRGITRSDMQFMREAFDAAGIPRRRHAWHFNAQIEEWELYAVVDLPDEPGGVTKVAYYSIVDGWVVI